MSDALLLGAGLSSEGLWRELFSSWLRDPRVKLQLASEYVLIKGLIGVSAADKRRLAGCLRERNIALYWRSSATGCPLVVSPALLLCDLDSSLIQTESLDELASLVR